MRTRAHRRSTRSLSSASDALASWLGSQDLAQQLRPHMARVHWAPVVGEQIAAVTQVTSVRDGVLTVRVKHSVWSNEINLLSDDILRRLNLELGGRLITKLHLEVTGLEPVSPPRSEPVRPVPTEEELSLIVLSTEKQAWVQQAISGIQDDTWRERMRHTLLRVSRAEEWKRQHGWHPCPHCATLAPPDFAVCDLCRVGLGPPSRP